MLSRPKTVTTVSALRW